MEECEFCRMEECEFCRMELYMGYIIVDVSSIVSIMTPQMKQYRSSISYKFCDENCALKYAKIIAERRLDKKYIKMIKERMVKY